MTATPFVREPVSARNIPQSHINVLNTPIRCAHLQIDHLGKGRGVDVTGTVSRREPVRLLHFRPQRFQTEKLAANRFSGRLATRQDRTGSAAKPIQIGNAPPPGGIGGRQPSSSANQCCRCVRTESKSARGDVAVSVAFPCEPAVSLTFAKPVEKRFSDDRSAVARGGGGFDPKMALDREPLSLACRDFFSAWLISPGNRPAATRTKPPLHEVRTRCELRTGANLGGRHGK